MGESKGSRKAKTERNVQSGNADGRQATQQGPAGSHASLLRKHSQGRDTYFSDINNLHKSHVVEIGNYGMIQFWVLRTDFTESQGRCTLYSVHSVLLSCMKRTETGRLMVVYGDSGFYYDAQ
jgi:hypothetical protein